MIKYLTERWNFFWWAYETGHPKDMNTIQLFFTVLIAFIIEPWE